MDLKLVVPVLLLAVHASSLKVLTLNLWNCGRNVHEGHAKIANETKFLNPDVVFFQEVSTMVCLENLKRLLPDYHSCGITPFGANAILYKKSDFDILKDVNEGSNVFSYFTATHYKVCQLMYKPSKRPITFVNVHLSYACYGPKVACGIEWSIFERDPAKLLNQCEERHRAKPLRALLERIDTHPELGNELVIFGGDFNAPSNLDHREKQKNCSDVPNWPTSELMEKHGYTDVFRKKHPNAYRKPGITWSPIVTPSRTYYGKTEPQDRIDYIFYRLPKVTSGQIFPTQAATYYRKPVTPVDHNGRVTPDVRKNAWPSDHAALTADFFIFA